MSRGTTCKLVWKLIELGVKGASSFLKSCTCVEGWLLQPQCLVLNVEAIHLIDCGECVGSTALWQPAGQRGQHGTTDLRMAAKEGDNCATYSIQLV